ncbi:MAG: hypothetical protein ACTJGQ_11940 [Agrococcus casei]|uniref:hypothetical protein n=1 Tax=Agrococcus casei TaxID=343512 RepID=UPI003F8DA513
MRYKFDEILNDLIDYFLLADVRGLWDFSRRSGLSPDLAAELTTTDAAERAVAEGALLPIPGVENLPYTVAFVTAPDTPELRDPRSLLVHEGDAYALRVDQGSLELFTWRVLEDFTESTVDALLEQYSRAGGPRIALENGWYRADVLAGWLTRADDSKPACEFVLTKIDDRPMSTSIDLSRRYSLAESPDHT